MPEIFKSKAVTVHAPAWIMAGTEGPSRCPCRCFAARFGPLRPSSSLFSDGLAAPPVALAPPKSHLLCPSTGRSDAVRAPRCGRTTTAWGRVRESVRRHSRSCPVPTSGTTARRTRPCPSYGPSPRGGRTPYRCPASAPCAQSPAPAGTSRTAPRPPRRPPPWSVRPTSAKRVFHPACCGASRGAGESTAVTRRPVFAAPLIGSPSRCPTTARVSTSAGRVSIMRRPGILPRPRPSIRGQRRRRLRRARGRFFRSSPPALASACTCRRIVSLHTRGRPSSRARPPFLSGAPPPPPSRSRCPTSTRAASANRQGPDRRARSRAFRCACRSRQPRRPRFLNSSRLMLPRARPKCRATSRTPHPSRRQRQINPRSSLVTRLQAIASSMCCRHTENVSGRVTIFTSQVLQWPLSCAGRGKRAPGHAPACGRRRARVFVLGYPRSEGFRTIRSAGVRRIPGRVGTSTPQVKADRSKGALSLSAGREQLLTCGSAVSTSAWARPSKDEPRGRTRRRNSWFRPRRPFRQEARGPQQNRRVRGVPPGAPSSARGWGGIDPFGTLAALPHLGRPTAPPAAKQGARLVCQSTLRNERTFPGCVSGEGG
jgi:hypothetical protein